MAHDTCYDAVTMADDTERKVFFVPQAPLPFIVGGSELHTTQTMKAMRLLGVDARWLPIGEAGAVRAGDVVHFFGCPSLATGWQRLTPPGVLDVVSPIFYEARAFQRALWRIGTRLRGTLRKHVATLMRRARAVIVYSHAEARQVQQLWGVAADRMHVVHNACEVIQGDAALFWDVLNPGLDPAEPFVLSVGRWEPCKRTLNTVRAALGAGTQLLLVGKPAPWVPSSYIGYIEELISASHGRLQSIPWMEHSQLCHCYAAAHAHVLASERETPGLASLEAGASGCNLVVGESPPVREYLADMAEYASGSVASIRDAILRAMDQPRDSHGQSRTITESFTWEKSAIATLEAYGWQGYSVGSRA
jgi:glycosyltransferase involved in cell wall biosynthesis